MSAALKIDEVPAGTVHASEVRAFVVSEYRRLADALESGALNGARIEWRDGEGCARVSVVELDAPCRFCRANIEHECKREVRMINTEITGREDQ